MVQDESAFVKGFLTGQAVLGVLLFFLLKVFLLRNGSDTRAELRKPKKPFKIKVDLSIEAHHDKLNRMNLHKRTVDTLILSKLQHEISTHPAEGCDWLNVLTAQIMHTFRNDQSFLAGLSSKIDLAVNSDLKRPAFLVSIRLNSFGSIYQIKTNNL